MHAVTVILIKADMGDELGQVIFLQSHQEWFNITACQAGRLL